MSVGGQLHGDARRSVLAEAPFALPVISGTRQKSLCRDGDPQARGAGQAESAVAFPTHSVCGPARMPVHGNLDGHARTVAFAVVAIASPTLAGHVVVQVGVRRHADGDAPVVHIEVT